MKTLSECLSDFLTHLSLEKNYSPHTLEAYSRHLSAVVSYFETTPIGKHPEKLSAAKLRSILLDYFSPRASISFQSQCISALKHFLRFLHFSGVLKDDQAAFLILPYQPQNLPKIITEEDVFALLEAPNAKTPLGLRDRALLETLYGSGCRISELTHLNISDITFESGTIRVLGKRQMERLLPIPERTMFWLKLYIEEVRNPLWAAKKASPYVMLSTGGRHLSRVHAWRIVQKYTSLAGIHHCSPHTLRHAFASHLVQNGADLRSVQSLLGHSSLRSTQIYTRVGPKHLTDLVNAHHLLS